MVSQRRPRISCKALWSVGLEVFFLCSQPYPTFDQSLYVRLFYIPRLARYIPNPILGEQTPNPWPIISRLYKKRGHCYYTPSTPNHADSKANMKLFANHIAMHIESALGDTQSTGKSNFELKTMLTPINGGAYSRMKREVCIVTPPMPRK
jgi:hypothetical protein